MFQNQSAQQEEQSSLSQEECRLLQAVANELSASGYSALAGVRVRAVAQTVVLEGEVPTGFCKQLAQAIAWRARGVKGVVNRLEVGIADTCAA